MEAYVLLSVAGEKPTMVAQGLLGFDDVDNVHVVYGDCDLIAHVVTDDFVNLRENVVNKIINLRGVKRVSTLIVAD